MQLTRFSDLSLRLLMYLAGRGQEETSIATARATAKLFNVPYTHMVKVVHKLGTLGLLTTTKGKGGGLRLALPPEEIRVGQILRQTEPRTPIINCWEPICPLHSDCVLKRALDRAYEQFFRELDTYTLGQVAETPSLRALVEINVPRVVPPQHTLT